MHIFFSGIGGTAIGPLALIAKQAGYTVSGSDKQSSSYIDYLKHSGIDHITIGQTLTDIKNIHSKNSIDWYVYSSAVAIENPNSLEFKFVKEMGIKTSKRDELINLIVKDKKLKMLAIAGTHGKTTTTAMLIWLFKSLNEPLSYSVGAKINFGEMGQYETGSKYFIYEADEFDRNFLAFEPEYSLITGVTWDHHEVFPTREDYQEAFREFISQTNNTIIWKEDLDYLNIEIDDKINVLDSSNEYISQIRLKGLYNRLDAYLAVTCFCELTGHSIEQAIEIINKFPGTSRRMEEISLNLYSDYAHTPEKIRGAMSVAREMADDAKQSLAIVYEPLTNRRQHFMIDEYQDCFDGASELYIVPSYLAREDPSQRIIGPEELIGHLSDPSIAKPKLMNQDLRETISTLLKNNAMVVCLSGGGGHSLDEWIRENFKK